MIDGWRIHKAVRWVVIAAGTFILMYYGLEGAKSVLAGLLVFIGASAVGVGWTKAWPEPPKTKTPLNP
jgi:hypothetical protein